MNRERMAAVEAEYDRQRSRNLYGAAGESAARDAAQRAGAKAEKSKSK